MPARRPNLVLLITDQQRAPMHWPEDPGWLDALAPNDAELRRTGLTFTTACTATAMCSPSRASFLTGTYPSRHGVTLTLTMGDLFPDVRNSAHVTREAAGMALRGDAPRGRLARAYLRGLTRSGPRGGDEPELPAGIPTLATRLRAAGYHVAYKGKWHLTKPVGGGEQWTQADSERIERDFGFAGWEPPDAGENARAEHFGAGNAGTTGMGWDEDYIRQVERFLAQPDLPEPFCLVVSLVNPHDVLGFPAQYERGGFTREQFAGLGVPLPPTLEENLSEKPSVHSLMRLGQTAYLGPLRTREQQQDYVDFYAWLHSVVDEKIGRLLAALGDAGDPRSLRSRTVITRISDHGEMGLSHGGLRQKMFNAYEETIRVPLVVSSPLLFPQPQSSDALVSLVDVVPTLLGLGGAPADGTIDGRSLVPLIAGHARPEAAAVEAAGVELGAAASGPAAGSVRDALLFTYDDHQAATAMQEAPGQPNRIRCVRDERWKYAVYLDPNGRTAPEHECYDLAEDPCEQRNLVGKATGAPRTRAAANELPRLREALAALCEQTGTTEPALPV
jgi:arylsulfatase A-like enzyme